MRINPAARAAATARLAVPFPGVVADAGWFPGSGVMPVPMGLYVDVVTNPSTRLSFKTKVDAATDTVTITLRGKAGRPNQQANAKRELELGVPAGLQMSHEYKLLVKDQAGRLLKQTTINTFAAA